MTGADVTSEQTVDQQQQEQWTKEEEDALLKEPEQTITIPPQKIEQKNETKPDSGKIAKPIVTNVINNPPFPPPLIRMVSKYSIRNNCNENYLNKNHDDKLKFQTNAVTGNEKVDFASLNQNLAGLSARVSDLATKVDDLFKQRNNVRNEVTSQPRQRLSNQAAEVRNTLGQLPGAPVEKRKMFQQVIDEIMTIAQSKQNSDSSGLANNVDNSDQIYKQNLVNEHSSKVGCNSGLTMSDQLKDKITVEIIKDSYATKRDYRLTKSSIL